VVDIFRPDLDMRFGTCASIVGRIVEADSNHSMHFSTGPSPSHSENGGWRKA
jgi:hypothetical protein